MRHRWPRLAVGRRRLATKPSGMFARTGQASCHPAGYSQAFGRSGGAGTTAKPCGMSVETKPVALSRRRGCTMPPGQRGPLWIATAVLCIATAGGAVAVQSRVITTVTSASRRWVLD
jgi:hypothetical protein